MTRLLQPFEQLEEYRKLGCLLTQEEKIQTVENSIALWVWEIRKAECEQICKIMSSMARRTEVHFAFPDERIKYLVSETLRKIDKYAAATDDA